MTALYANQPVGYQHLVYAHFLHSAPGGECRHRPEMGDTFVRKYSGLEGETKNFNTPELQGVPLTLHPLQRISPDST
jgi:hypothetical protein